MKADTLQEKLQLACGIAKSCFDRGMGSGTTGNLSFRHNGYLFITAGGTCFGFLKPEDFAAVRYDEESDLTLFSDADRAFIEQAVLKKPSKELPLHQLAYERLEDDGIHEGAIIHTHATYAVLWSCIPNLDTEDCVPDVTPYLRMKMGSCGLIPYEKPGSKELFDSFAANRGTNYGWILSHHGLLTCGKDLMEAFGRSEELEETCKIAWNLRQAGLLSQ